MEQSRQGKWDYILCRACPVKESENFVIGDDVGKEGVGICPTCGTEIYHVKCDECGDELEIDKTCSEFHAEDHTWECPTCRNHKRRSLPGGQKITILKDLPSELEVEFQQESAAIRAKVRRIGTAILIGIFLVTLIMLLK